jgi:hypothetical protein
VVVVGEYRTRQVDGPDADDRSQHLTCHDVTATSVRHRPDTDLVVEQLRWAIADVGHCRREI